MSAQKPNILFMLTDNLGYGELGVYGGGATRGAPTPRIDKLASEGLRLTNMNMEAQCTPSRSAILTGRYAIRSGTHSVPFGGIVDGLTQWEVTMAESLSDVGYATALYGKWHLGSQNGRLPNDQGFDEWYGIPRTTDEALWPTAAGYSPSVMPPEQIMEGRKGQKSLELKVYDLDQRRIIDAEITRRTVAFMERQTQARKPFFAYATLTQPHLPTLPNPAFAGKTGNGDWADMLAEMDANVGQMLDAVDRLGIRDNTIVMFSSDNGPEFVRPYDGWPGPWRDASRTDILQWRLPAIHDTSGDRPVIGGRNLEHHWSGLRRVKEGHEVDGVGVGRQRLVLPVQQARPIDDLVPAALRLGRHRLVHEIGIHCRHAPNDGLDAPPPHCPLGQIG